MNLNPKWPFKLERGLPRAHATSAGGTDSSSFEMVSVPDASASGRRRTTFTTMPGTRSSTPTASSCRTPNTSSIPRWSRPSSLTARPTSTRRCTREGVYLPDGLYAAFAIGPTDAPIQIMTTLDYLSAPLQTANFVRIVEGQDPRDRPARHGSRPGRASRPAAAGEPGAPGQPRPESRRSASFDMGDRIIKGVVVSEIQKSVAVASLPLTPNPSLKHDAAGVLGVSGPNAFYLTLQKNAGLDATSTAIGKTIAGLDLLAKVKKGDAIRSIRIVRVGQAARDFKTDDEAFKKLLEKGK